MRSCPPIVPGLAALAAFGLGWTSWPEAAQDGGQVLDAKLHHLGDSEVAEWAEVSVQPQGQRLELEFEARRNPAERALRLTVQDADHPWTLEVNGRKAATLRPAKERRTLYLELPAGALRNGRNVLRLIPTNSSDDILVGDLHLMAESLRELMRLQDVVVQVRDADSGQPLAARLTIVDAAGAPAPVYYAEGPRTAVRDGIVCQRDGAVRFSLPPGRYTIWAARGTEWGADRAELEVGAAPPPQVELSIRREVDTRGWIAADTHLHTYTYSGHGDATVEERLLTLAVDGVELAVATDHNHNTDYRPLQRALQLESAFTAVTGNEVTTEFGHLNAFPLDPGAAPPRHEYATPDYVQIVHGIRDRGAQVVVLNHPRWPKPAEGPFGIARLNSVSGERLEFARFPIDAMEIFNATEEGPKVVDLVLADWFALLNHGAGVPVVGTSDSHTVGDIVGQGRTYLPSRSDDPARISVDGICAAFRRGEFSASLGIFATADVGGHGMGSTLRVRGDTVTMNLRVACASWVLPGTARVYCNGRLAAELAVPHAPGQPTDARLHVAVPRPAQDAWLVCVVRGPEQTQPFWRTSLRMVGAVTNPIYLDADGDGRYSSPRAIAQRVVDQAGSAPERLAQALRPYDAAVAVQAASLAAPQWAPADFAANLQVLAGGEPERTQALQAYAREVTALAAAAAGAE
ncbi:MAG: hypothetical protein EYC70_00005 [Planctomycetota bacterium]|nr:MAG: hypothetical protein EYC70_00005 [Planctomycetota bacterium]